MKIGVVTINDNYNYGNRLQNYATQIFLNKLNFDCVTIKNKPLLNKKKNNLEYILRNIKSFLCRNKHNGNRQREKFFEKFNEKINFSRKTFNWFNLEWLKDYPNTRKTYIIALRQYSEGIYIRDMADNLRKALETFLQEFLSNKKNLETNKNEICRYLGSQGIDAGVTGLFQPLINAYKNINDRIVKHNDAIDEKLLEFLLYQTGVLIRMVLSVKQVEKKNKHLSDN